MITNPMIEELRARKAALKMKTHKLSPEEEAEAKERDEIAAEEARLREEKSHKATLDNARILDAARKRAGVDVLLELVDLNADTPGAGVYVIRNPPTVVSDAMKDAIRLNGQASTLDVVNFVIGSLVYPDTEIGDTGVEIRDTFDRFGFAAQSLSNVALRLGGLKIEEKRKSR